ncbi:GntR family transcriptional regulator [Ancylobacter oerskovii]|uniref:GntR family transcriptional regulator n=1 Tax=Ancylobacter oerskovii TaxID=459519 RepID=A0ABW4YWF2_9HYPH|nr:GntR family transcriptional regulator [Ancylobacter oerskovii]MBS7544155.1 GntR family transcriptional regulator [Ancylobacter oerskovii]
MPRTSLSPQVTLRIIEHIRTHNLKRGHHLAAQALADSFRISRGPVNAALRALETMQIVRSEPNRGYFLARDAEELGEAALAADAGIAGLEEEPEEKVYFAIAEDRLSGKLPDRMSESELMRLYDVPRSQLLRILHRIIEEGWIERLPGNGWEFRPLLASRESYEQGYQFRAAVESQALLLPSFRIDAAAFEAARQEQQWLLDGGYRTASRTELFRANTGFHEMLAGCSRNAFFIDAVRRVNRLRRLLEYRISLDRTRLPQQCREHLTLLTLIEKDLRHEAADFLRVHIEGASAIKSPHIGGSS